MVVPICPKCGAIMNVKVLNGVEIAVCPVCGYNEPFAGKLQLDGITPPDFRVESRMGRGIALEGRRRQIRITEDEQREVWNILAGEAES